MVNVKERVVGDRSLMENGRHLLINVKTFEEKKAKVEKADRRRCHTPIQPKDHQSTAWLDSGEQRPIRLAIDTSLPAQI